MGKTGGKTEKRFLLNKDHKRGEGGGVKNNEHNPKGGTTKSGLQQLTQGRMGKTGGKTEREFPVSRLATGQQQQPLRRCRKTQIHTNTHKSKLAQTKTNTNTRKHKHIQTQTHKNTNT